MVLRLLRHLPLLAALFLCNGLHGQDAPPKLTEEQEKLLDEVQHKAFLFFWEEGNPETGLIRDRASNSERPSTNKDIASIASVGFGLSAYPIAVEHGWIKRDEALTRTLNTLKFFLESVDGHQGLFYHFVDINTGKRAWKSELSSIDTALFLAGALFAKEYFKDAEVSKLVDALYERCDFPWMMNKQPFICMEWKPEKGFGAHYWNGFNEGILLTLLAIGSPAHPVDPQAWQSVKKRVGEYKGHRLVSCPPLFTHQYPHCWIDFRGKNDGRVDYFRNSTEATLANRQFCIDNAAKYKSYSQNSWGLTASDGPAGYKAYGAPPGKAPHDGTIAPTGAITSIMFTPDIALAALEHFRRQTDLPLWGKYGFADSFNLDKKWVDKDVIGIDQGALLLGIENHRTGLVWKHMMKNDAVQRAMGLIGFKEGTVELQLEQQPRYLVAKAPAPLKIDGDLGDWKTESSISLNRRDHLEFGAAESDNDASAKAQFMWDDNYFYFGIAVKDDERVSLQTKNLIWKDDCIELYIDPQNDNLVWEGKKDLQLGFSPGADGIRVWSWWSEKKEPLTDGSIVAKQALKDDGYVIEAAIQWKFLGVTPKEGLIFGASPALHDKDQKDGSEAKLIWYFEDVGGAGTKQLGRMELSK